MRFNYVVVFVFQYLYRVIYLQLTMKGHNFVLHQYYTVTYCNHCQLIIWGISPQGYQCTSMFLSYYKTNDSIFEIIHLVNNKINNLY